MSSMITVDSATDAPIYEQLVENIKILILAGAIMPDEQLPSVRQLAGEMGVNPNTIQKAYAELERQGISYTVPGKGCFVNNDIKRLFENRQSDILSRLHSVAREASSASIEYERLETELKSAYYTNKEGTR